MTLEQITSRLREAHLPLGSHELRVLAPLVAALLEEETRPLRAERDNLLRQFGEMADSRHEVLQRMNKAEAETQALKDEVEASDAEMQRLRDAARALREALVKLLDECDDSIASLMDLESPRKLLKRLAASSSPSTQQESDHRPSTFRAATFDGVNPQCNLRDTAPSGDEPGRIPPASSPSTGSTP